MSKVNHSTLKPRDARGGFTLIEVMIAASLALVILAAVFSTFIFIGKSSFRLGQYTDMESHARRALHQFSQDVRQASHASWTDVNTLHLTVNGQTVIYAYKASASTFSRKQGTAAATVLISGITQFSFTAYQLTGTELPMSSSLAAVGAAVKMIQITLNLERTAGSTGKTSSQIISSRCVMRNKKFS